MVRRNTFTKIEGDFLVNTTTSQSEYREFIAERVEKKIHTDNLKIGGEFLGRSSQHIDYTAVKTERSQPAKHNDNLSVGGGEFKVLPYT
jgi:hypothetical protein